jgi:hypothetical protein
MTQLAQAIAGLSDVLARENQALTAQDLRSATALLNDKREAAEAFSRAHATALPAPGRSLRPGMSRLRDLATENRILLERAIAVQGAVMAIVARAVPPPAVGPGYARSGAAARSRQPLALSARI